jgi:hypothetical protein
LHLFLIIVELYLKHYRFAATHCHPKQAKSWPSAILPHAIQAAEAGDFLQQQSYQSSLAMRDSMRKLRCWAFIPMLGRTAAAVTGRHVDVGVERGRTEFTAPPALSMRDEFIPQKGRLGHARSA